MNEDLLREIEQAEKALAAWTASKQEEEPTTTMEEDIAAIRAVIDESCERQGITVCGINRLTRWSGVAEVFSVELVARIDQQDRAARMLAVRSGKGFALLEPEDLLGDVAELPEMILDSALPQADDAHPEIIVQGSESLDGGSNVALMRLERVAARWRTLFIFWLPWLLAGIFLLPIMGIAQVAPNMSGIAQGFLVGAQYVCVAFLCVCILWGSRWGGRR